MSISLKTLPHMTKYHKEKDLYIQNSLNRDNSIEKPPKHISLKNLFYQNGENSEKIKSKIKLDLPILNYLTTSPEKKTSIKTAITYSKPEYDYNICMINKFEENLDTSLSFISEFDLEENVNSINESFISSDEENTLFD